MENVPYAIQIQLAVIVVLRVEGVVTPRAKMQYVDVMRNLYLL
jgi:hypothetical protein